MIHILHITPHIGGGIGSALHGITAPLPHYRHDVLLLESPQKPQGLDKLKDNGCVFHMPDADISSLLAAADIVQFHWWHHPAMCRFLNTLPTIPIRAVLWVHVSGCTYPYLRAALLQRFQHVFFACRHAYDNPEVAALPPPFLSEQTSIVYGMGDVTPFTHLTPIPHQGFRVGYVGTLSYSKLHPDFTHFCAAAPQDTHFIMVGDPQNADCIRADCATAGAAQPIDFLGFRTDVAQLYQTFDAFGYPLHPLHFGATENVILEAMASGLPVVALRQAVEQHIVQDGVTGILADDPTSYGRALTYLRDHPTERQSMGMRARQSVMERFSVQDNLQRLHAGYRAVMAMDKHPVSFAGLWGGTPADWFLYAVEAERPLFTPGADMWQLPHIFKETSKSSVHHFASVYPDDPRLALWSQQLKEAERHE